MAATWKKIAFEDDVILKSLLDADTVLTATSDDTPIATTMAEQTVLGRLTGGHPDDVAIGIADNNIVQIDQADAADNDFAKFTANGLEGRSYAETLTDLFSVTLPENTAITLDASLSADGKYSGIVEAGTAGTALVFGNLCYLANVDGKWELTDANSAPTCTGKLGICVLAAAENAATTILLWGKVNAASLYPQIANGESVFVGEIAGNIQVAPPIGDTDIICTIGYGSGGTDEIFFCPDVAIWQYLDDTSGGNDGAVYKAATANALFDTMTAHGAAADPHAGYILESLIAAKGDLIGASANDTPAILSVGTDAKVLTADADAANGLGIDWINPAAPAAHTLNSHTAANGAVDFGAQQAHDVKLDTYATAAELTAIGVIGQIAWATDTLHPYVCTIAA